MSSADYRIDWLTPGTGNGGSTGFSTDYVTHTVVGQVVASGSGSENYQASMGYWQVNQAAAGPESGGAVFLPLVIR